MSLRHQNFLIFTWSQSNSQQNITFQQLYRTINLFILYDENIFESKSLMRVGRGGGINSHSMTGSRPQSRKNAFHKKNIFIFIVTLFKCTNQKSFFCGKLIHQSLKRRKNLNVRLTDKWWVSLQKAPISNDGSKIATHRPDIWVKILPNL